jgi:hypothetical protein
MDYVASRLCELNRPHDEEKKSLGLFFFHSFGALFVLSLVTNHYQEELYMHFTV